MEELKLVLESMEALGEDGREVFVWWLIAKYGSAFAKFFFGSVTLLFAARWLTSSITKATDLEKRQFEQRLDDIRAGRT